MADKDEHVSFKVKEGHTIMTNGGTYHAGDTVRMPAHHVPESHADLVGVHKAAAPKAKPEARSPLLP